jgi:hypothetical protein
MSDLARCLQVGKVAVAEVAAVKVRLRDAGHHGKIDAGLAENTLVDFRIISERWLNVGVVGEAFSQLRLMTSVLLFDVLLEARCSRSLRDDLGRRLRSLYVRE